MSCIGPLNFARLIERSEAIGRLATEVPASDDGEGRIERVDGYRCTVCQEFYESHEKQDAIDCCAPGNSGVESIACPACGAEAKDYHLAASCCLWKDLDAPTRTRIADDMDANSDTKTWAEVLAPYLPRPL